jgi:hypothetical protein
MIVKLKSSRVSELSTKRYEDDADVEEQQHNADQTTNFVHYSYTESYDRQMILALSRNADTLPYNLRRCGLDVQVAVSRQALLDELCRAGLYEDDTELVRHPNDEPEKLYMSEKLIESGYSVEMAIHAFYNKAITTEFTFWTRQYASTFE